MGSVKVAIVGVGNCAASLVQGVHYYRDADETTSVPGLMHVRFGDYHVSDVEFVAAFDVDASKVGLDLGKAVFAGQNNTIRFAQVGEVGVVVQRGPTFDGLGKYYRETVEESPALPVDVTQVDPDVGPVRQRRQAAGWIVAVESEVESKVVARAGRNHQQWHTCFGGYAGHESLRAVPAGHPQ